MYTQDIENIEISINLQKLNTEDKIWNVFYKTVRFDKHLLLETDFWDEFLGKLSFQYWIKY